METKRFPGCCTVRVVVGFGNTMIAEYGWNVDNTVEEIKEYLVSEAHFQKRNGKAMLTATTNNQQKTANKALRAVGFKRTKWMSKPQHPHTKVALWWKVLQEQEE